MTLTATKSYTYDEAFNASLDYFNGDELAAKVFVDKYALRDNDDVLLELTPEDMHWRLANEFARIEAKKFNNPLSAQEIFNLLDKFKRIVPQGSPMFGIGNTYKYISISNCTLAESPGDSYGHICNSDQQLVQLSKRRAGVGIDISRLRPVNAPVRNSAKTSTGITSFMQRFSNSIREVGQFARRGALMLTCDVTHPEIENFITIKNDPTKVTGANISVKLTDEFLNAVKEDKEFTHRWPVDSNKPQITKTIKARELWKTIIFSAWNRAEPGLLFWDTILKESVGNAYKEEGFTEQGTNPSLRGDTLVATNYGYIPISTLANESNLYLGLKVSNIKGEWHSATAFMSGQNKQLYEITFNEHIKKAYCTAEHKWPIINKDNQDIQKKQTKDLNSGDIIPYNRLGEYVSIKNIAVTDIFEDVYDITVFDDTHTFLTEFGITGNCSEIPLPPLDSCRLLVLNLLSYVKNPFTNKAEFDYIEFTEDAKLAQRLMDDIVDLEIESIEKIIKKIEEDPEEKHIKTIELGLWEKMKATALKGRRTGTGVTAVGDTLAALGIKYANEESIKVVEKIYKTLKLACFRSSVDMARELGPFPIYDREKEKNNPFLLRIKDEDIGLYNDMMKYGRRNIMLLTTAPAGTVSILTQTTSGIEPLFMMSYNRRKKGNANDKDFRVDFVDPSGDCWQEFRVYHPTLKSWMQITGETDEAKSPWHQCCAENIDWKNRVKLQAAAQKHVDHAISSTINLPENISKERVAEIYEAAWTTGIIKGITIYRDKCRTGVLVAKEDSATKNSINKTNAPTRPKKMDCDIHHLTVKGIRYFAVVGLLGNDPYEIFINRNCNADGEPLVNKAISRGILHKIKRGHYQLLDKEDKEIANIFSVNADEHEEALARMVSTSLRHGADIQFIVHQLEKTRGDMQGFTKVMARSLKKYIKDGFRVSGESCQSCGSDLVRQDGCVSCKSCGWSKC